MGNQPLERDINIVLLLARYRVAADLAVLNGVQVHLLDEAVLIQRPGQVPLVPQHQNWNPCQLWLFKEVVKLVPGGLDLLQVGGVHHVDDGIHASAVPLPHGSESWLSSNVPQLDGDVPLGDLPHVESHCGDHVLVEAPGGDDVDKGGFPRVLQPHQGQLHLLLPEEGLEPLQEPVDHGQHDGGV